MCLILYHLILQCAPTFFSAHMTLPIMNADTAAASQFLANFSPHGTSNITLSEFILRLGHQKADLIDRYVN